MLFGFERHRFPHPGIIIMAHYAGTRYSGYDSFRFSVRLQNQRHIPGMNLGFSATLQAKIKWDDRVPNLLEANLQTDLYLDRCRGAGPRYGQKLNITAVCVSIDRFLQDTAPFCCLLFDGVGARHLGIASSAGSNINLGSPVTQQAPSIFGL